MKIPTTVITAIALCAFYNHIFCMEIEPKRHIPSLFQLCITKGQDMLCEENKLLYENPHGATFENLNSYCKKKLSIPGFTYTVQDNNIIHSDEDRIITLNSGIIEYFDNISNKNRYFYTMDPENFSPIMYKQCLDAVFWNDCDNKISIINSKGIKTTFPNINDSYGIFTNFNSCPHIIFFNDNFLFKIFNLETKNLVEDGFRNFSYDNNEQKFCIGQTEESTTIYSLIENKIVSCLKNTSYSAISPDGKYVIAASKDFHTISFVLTKTGTTIFEYFNKDIFKIKKTSFNKSGFCTIQCITENLDYLFLIFNIKNNTLCFTISSNLDKDIYFEKHHLVMLIDNLALLIHRKDLSNLAKRINNSNTIYTIEELLSLNTVLEFADYSNNHDQIVHPDGKHIISIDEKGVLSIIHIKSEIIVLCQENVSDASFLEDGSLRIMLKDKTTYLLNLSPRSYP